MYKDMPYDRLSYTNCGNCSSGSKSIHTISSKDLAQPPSQHERAL
jgi:hypothetical protein